MNVDQLLTRIVFMAQNFGDRDADCVIKICLMDIGISCGKDGYKYIVSGAVLLHKNPNAMITKHIYPAIAKEFGCSTMQVEASIRRTIHTACDSRNEKWLTYFSEDKRPGNSEFLSMLCEVLSIWEACKKKIANTGVGEGE